MYTGYILSKINQLQYFYHANIHKSVIHAMGTFFDGSGIKKKYLYNREDLYWPFHKELIIRVYSRVSNPGYIARVLLICVGILQIEQENYYKNTLLCLFVCIFN